MRDKKPQTRQLSFREENSLAERIEAAAKVEELSTADFVRKVFRLGFRSYEVAGSLYALRTRLDVYEQAKAAVETEQEAAKRGAEAKSKKTLRH